MGKAVYSVTSSNTLSTALNISQTIKNSTVVLETFSSKSVGNFINDVVSPNTGSQESAKDSVCLYSIREPNNID